MKKIILLAITIFSMVGCNDFQKEVYNDYAIYTIDSCEYIKVVAKYGISHKGNCKYCAKRRKQELQEVIKLLKGE